MSNAPKAPSGLGKPGRSLWTRITADVHASWELDARDLAFLTAACQAEDRACELDDLVKREGLTVTGSTDQQRLHPGIGEARLRRAQVAVLLSKVELTVPQVSMRRMTAAQRAEHGALDGSA